jgi:hypothetical protein
MQYSLNLKHLRTVVGMVRFKFNWENKLIVIWVELLVFYNSLSRQYFLQFALVIFIVRHAIVFLFVGLFIWNVDCAVRSSS